MFQSVNFEEIIEQDKDKCIVILACPNYEERSIYCLSKMLSLADDHMTNIKPEILFLKGRKNNNYVLEELKTQYSNNLKTKLSKSNIMINNCWHKIDYPSGYNSRGLVTRITDKLKGYSKNNDISIHIDISSMPKFIIFNLCEALSSWMDDDNIRIKKAYFSYVSPKQYSQLPYAQEIGLLRGFFSSQPISVENQQDVRAIIIPSMTGHEGKLLLDELNQIAYEQRNAIFLPILAKDILTSLEIMRANQIITEHDDSTQYYYCSIMDAIDLLSDYLSKEERERIKYSPDSKRLYLVAPFGSKIMLPVSYFLLKKIKEENKNIDIEICDAQGFQYTSVYSIGIGEVNTFSLEINDNADKNKNM